MELKTEMNLLEVTGDQGRNNLGEWRRNKSNWSGADEKKLYEKVERGQS